MKSLAFDIIILFFLMLAAGLAYDHFAPAIIGLKYRQFFPIFAGICAAVIRGAQILIRHQFRS